MLTALFKFRKSSPPAPQWLQSTYLPLLQAIRKRTFIWVTIAGDDTTYQSLILESDTTEQTLLIDELFPGPINASVGQSIHIHIRQENGQNLTFDSEILENHTYNGAPIHVVSMPSSLDHCQRRNAFRLPLATMAQTECTFAVNGHNYCGQLQDLSISGLCLQAPTEAAISLHVGSRLYNLEFELLNSHIDCDVKVRHIDREQNAAEQREKTRDNAKETDNSDHNRIKLGTEFDDILPQDRRHLEQAINELQRQQRKQAEDSIF